MENRDEQLIKDFFNDKKLEIQDDGFSKRVIKQLPDRHINTGWIVPLFTLIGVIIAGFIIDLNEVILGITDWVFNIPIYYFLGTIMLLPILILLGYLYWERSHFSRFTSF